MYNLSAAMGPRWAEICTEFTEKIKKIGSHIVGRESVLEDIRDCAHELLPSEIADAACPKEVKTIYQWYKCPCKKHIEILKASAAMPK